MHRSNALSNLPGVNPSAIAELYATLAGLPQPLPGWLAGGLSSLGVWLSLPINWLGGWIVYGALVMAVNVALGATCTLQRFYAATGYAVVPLLLTAFAPVACLGPLASLIGVLWAIAVYVRANQDVTGLPLLHSGLAVALPALILLFGAFLVAVLLLGSFVLAVI